MVSAALAFLLLTGCRLDTTVTVVADADGSGRVRAVATLDHDAAQRVPDLADQLRVGDLAAAGWVVGKPTTAQDGSVSVEAVRRFRSPGEATQAVEELSGVAGPFRDFRLRRTRSFLKTRTDLQGRVDLTSGIEGFGDDALKRRLGSSSLGFDPTELERELGAKAADVFHFKVVARLPGKVAEWQPTLGQTTAVQATSEQWNGRNIAAVAVAVLSGLAALALVVERLLHRRYGPARTGG